MANEEDPKEVARIERQRPEVDRMLRQFLNTDGPKGTSEQYRANYETSMRKDPPGFKCDECDHAAYTLEELHRHEEADHTHCRKCGNPFTLTGDSARAGVVAVGHLWHLQLCNRCVR